MNGVPATLGVVVVAAAVACGAGLGLGAWGWAPSLAFAAFGGAWLVRREQAALAAVDRRTEAWLESLGSGTVPDAAGPPALQRLAARMAELERRAGASEQQAQQAEDALEAARREVRTRLQALAAEARQVLERGQGSAEQPALGQPGLDPFQELFGVVADLEVRLKESGSDIAACGEAGRLAEEAWRELAPQRDRLQEDLRAVQLRMLPVGQAAREVRGEVEQVRTRGQRAAETSHRALGEAEQSQGALREAVAGFETLQGEVTQVVEVVRNLGGRIHSIGAILNVIEDVTEQTNLLALNAAIIAAQAGEHGRGFAVVADEIRDLAERTTDSTKEIAGLIEAVQSESDRAVAMIGGEVEQVHRGVEQAGAVAGLLGSLLGRLREVSQDVAEVAALAERAEQGVAKVATAFDAAEQAWAEEPAPPAGPSAGGEALARVVERSERLQQAAEEVAFLLGRLRELADRAEAAGRGRPAPAAEGRSGSGPLHAFVAQLAQAQ